jgi:tetratricopeptide (TPR) repeat protein
MDHEDLPMHPDHTMLLKEAQALDQVHKPLEASIAYQRFLAMEPRHADAWSILAGMQMILGDPERAQNAAWAALEIDPHHLAARVNLGRALYQSNRIEDAEFHLRSVWDMDAQRMDAPLFLAECRLNRRDLRGARNALDAATSLAARPGRSPAMLAHLAEIWAIYSMGLFEEQKLEEAEAACATALRFNGQNLSAKSSLGNIRVAQGHWEEAEGLFRRLVKEHPQDIDVRLQLIACLARKGNLSLADQEIAKIVQEEPGSITLHRGVMETHYVFGRWSECAAEIARFRAVDPSSPHPDFQQCFLDLLFGDFRQGWERHEARFRIPKELRPAQRSFSQPAWNGGPFEGKTLLLWAEEGFGDTLMFLRYIPRVKALGGQVIVEAQSALMDVAATCEGVDTVVPWRASWPQFDLQLSLHSLPWIFRTELSSIPAEIPYLQVPCNVPHRREILEHLALAKGDVRIGLVWAGSPLHPRDAERSLVATSLAPLGTLPGVSWYSLQVRREELPPLPNLTSLAPFLTNFSDTAFALSGLDLLITVDTSVAHLAGALGIPTLLLLTFVPDYRWMLDRHDSPWYPTMRLYRQPTYGDWGAVIQQVLMDLTQDA